MENDLAANQIIDFWENLDDFPFDPNNTPQDDDAKKQFILDLLRELAKEYLKEDQDDEKKESIEQPPVPNPVARPLPSCSVYYDSFYLYMTLSIPILIPWP